MFCNNYYVQRRGYILWCYNWHLTFNGQTKYSYFLGSTEFVIQMASSPSETSKELEKIIPPGAASEKSSTMRKVTLEVQNPPPEIRIQEPSKGE